MEIASPTPKNVSASRKKQQIRTENVVKFAHYLEKCLAGGCIPPVSAPGTTNLTPNFRNW